jgi:hypothetical protein
MKDTRNLYNILVGKTLEKRPPEIPRRRWEDNIKLINRRNKFPVVTVCCSTSLIY